MRLHLTLALITVIALVLTLRAEKKHRFAFAEVDQMAQRLATAKFTPPPEEMPPQLKKLTPQQEAGIFWKDKYRLWRKKGLPFQVDFYHQLNSNPLPHVSPQINTVDSKGSHILAYSPSFFNFINFATKPPSTLEFNPPLPNNLGYAGFYVRYPDMGIGSNPNSLDGFFSVLGASYLRVIAKEQVYGISARGLLITKANDNKPDEEFPIFTQWWLQEPSDPNILVVDALLNSPSVAGAYEFKIHPGGVTSVDIHASLYFRQPVERLGIASFSSMFLFGENSKVHFKDTVHPEVHDSDGLLMNNSGGEWVWRPLGQSNDPDAGPKEGMQLQHYVFADENPKGFGLLQRDRNFQHYQDLNAKYNARPSAWVIPHGNWGKGELHLIQRPSDDPTTDNVVFYWHPAQAIEVGTHLTTDYTIDFYMNDAQRPPLAYAKQTLINCPAPPPPPPVLPPNVPPPPPKTNAPVGPPAATPPAKTNAAPIPAPPATKPATNAPAAMGPPERPPGPPIPVGTEPVQFMVDFAGNGIENTPANQPPDLDLSFDPPGTYVRERSVEKNGYDNSWRVTFTIIPFKHTVPTNLRCLLKHNNKPITETWIYTWNQ